MDEATKAKLAINAANAWKMWSNYVMGASGVAFSIYLSLPPDQQQTLLNHIPVAPWLVPIFASVVGIVARLWPQKSITPTVAAAKSDDAPQTSCAVMDFDSAFGRLLGHEGGYVNDPSDPGGETKYGVSKRSYPGEDIKNLTLDRAKELYRRDFWNVAGCDAVPEPIKFDLFDMAVNSGVRQAIKTLQKAVGSHEDGLLGGDTLQKAQTMSPDRVLMRFGAARLLYMTALGGWQTFGKGWCRRVAENILNA